MKRIGRIVFSLVAVVFMAGVLPFVMPEVDFPRGETAQQQWTWITSNQKYGKFFSPTNVHVERSVNGVATCISAWIKTAYTPAGAQETIENYGIQASIPDARQLSYSLARVQVIPQERKLFYLQENFYDTEGKIIWSRVHEPPKEYEITHWQFEEDYYDALVDQVFHYGESERKVDPDRWKQLWVSKTTGGGTTEAMADFTTMRLEGSNLIYWEWQETKDKDGTLLEINFMKKVLNPEQGTEKIIRHRLWTQNSVTGDFIEIETDGRYAAITKESAAYHGLERLRAIVKGYQYWLNRYRVDLPQTANAKKDQKASQ